ncbi:hypothetical protein X801_06836, partial [Opisthorchis viverrini]
MRSTVVADFLLLLAAQNPVRLRNLFYLAVDSNLFADDVVNVWEDIVTRTPTLTDVIKNNLRVLIPHPQQVPVKLRDRGSNPDLRFPTLSTELKPNASIPSRNGLQVEDPSKSLASVISGDGISDTNAARYNDVIKKESITLDWEFKLSLITDVV